MKAILHTKYGPPDELELKEIDKPVPKDDEILIKVHASTVTSSDCNVRNLTFAPKSMQPMAKLYMGRKKPKINILGIDVAGVVESVGAKVKRFKPGDVIFGALGTKFGAHAEYVTAPETGGLALKPASLTFEQAAAISLAANTALFFIRNLGKIKAGQKVLIHGASGAIGTYAVQLAKHYGAEVTGLCSGANAEMVKSLGADKVIDYTKEDFTQTGELYDAVFSVVGKTRFEHCKKILKPKGVYLENWLEFKDIFTMLWTALVGGKKLKGGVALEKPEDIQFLKELIESGKLKPVIDRTYSLEQMVEAFKYVEKGHKKGNVVITVAHDNKT